MLALPAGIPPPIVVVAKSAWLHFRLTAKIAPAPLLLLSPQEPLRLRSCGGPVRSCRKENGPCTVQKKRTLSAELAHKAQVRLNTVAVLANCHQFSSLLPARAVLVPQIGFPRAYTPAVNVGGHRKACPPGPANATLALPGSTSGKRRRPVLFLESAFPACTLRRSSLVVVGKPVLLAPLAL